MKAKQLADILNLYPEADVKMWNDDIGSIVVTITEDRNVTVDLQRKKTV